jgi:alpha-tubulin suppressor-like RCC1 family protein
MTSYSSPVQVGALTTWSKVYPNRQSCFAIRTDGTLWAWGSGGQGRLGLGNTTSYSSPKQVGTLTNWLSFAGGNYIIGTSMAVKTDGTLWAWGNNQYGQLGLGNTTNYSSPVQIGALTNWLLVATSYSTWAIKNDGTLWAWGYGNQGALGLGNGTSYSSPKQVGALTNWSKVSGGGYYTNVAATKTDGTLWSWGNGTYGALGLGNTTTYNSPKQVGALTNWLKVTGGGYSFNLAIKTDGTLWAWGRNNSGQLGLGNTTDYSSPKQVGSGSWMLVATGQSTTIAIS